MAPNQAYMDGPAITPTGIVVDLEGGHSTFFSYSKESLPSYAEKEEAKEFHRMLRAVQLAHSLDEAKPLDLPSLDSDGHVRVPWVCLPLTGERYNINDLRKKIHRKKKSAQSKVPLVYCVDKAGVVQAKKKTLGLIAIDAGGTALAMDVTPQTPQDKENENIRKKLFHKKRGGSFHSDSDCILSMDNLGIVHKKEKWSLDIEAVDPDAHQLHHEPEAESPFASPKSVQAEPDAERSPEHRPMSFPMLPVSCY
eukprot:gnl/MRDRNA2_/MRDRNA2_111374_c0_seq1.p1 gnl/MRDRNA2_/MRDRNA2_111374_c0~~gnl/MRDRNA2_/MRDRNA2_111374_c0_seq1.p1  ORF type:complete len:252 (+),score=54.73 gnl/MRDRNA2_/MRDRNA2_111374_c0_seq1:80-835(+)